MKRLDYYNLRENFGVLEYVSNYYSKIDSFLREYPMFKNKTVQECFEYFEKRMSEEENKIEETLNVE